MENESYIPRWRLERIAEDVEGELRYLTCANSRETRNQVVIEYGRRPKENS